MTEQTPQHKLLDSVAMEALSAGIGLGTLKARQAKRATTKIEQPERIPVATPAPTVSTAPIVSTTQPRRWFRTAVAYLLDLLGANDVLT